MNPSSTIHGMPIPPGYASVTVEQIVELTHINENLELDFIRGDGEKTLGDYNTLVLIAMLIMCLTR